jgi:DNA polymerase III epsilon subunit-like protein
LKTLVLDLETTGLVLHPAAKDAIQPRMIEFGGIVIESSGTEIAELELLVNPGQPLEPIITKITGLTDDDLKGQPTFLEIWPRLKAFMAQADCLLSHNLPFDWGVLELELARNGITDYPRVQHNICTVQEHVPLFGYRPSLKVLHEYYMGEKLAQTHRALDDVRALAAIAIKAGVLL